MSGGLWKSQSLKSNHQTFIMGRLFSFLVVVVSIMACSSDSTSSRSSDDLVQLENDWMHAAMHRDRTTLDRLVAPEFAVTGIKYLDSAAVTRSVWMTNMMQDMKIDSVHFLKIKASKVDNLGIVTAEFYWSGNYGGKSFSDSTSFVDTWIKRAGDWRVVSRVMTE